MPDDPRPWPKRYRHEGGRICVDLRLRNERQLFDARDPAPFRERDLDDEAVEWILDSLEELPRGAPFKIVIHLSEAPPTMPPEAIREAIRAHFAYEVLRLQRRRKREVKDGAIFLVVALAILFLCLGLSLWAERLTNPALAHLLSQGLPIVGWVAMWRPLELFLYDWWPLRQRIALCQQAVDAEIEI
ncbi:MAG TPA: hypothetical protein VJ483_09605 [Holophagaceae bacterium]|nr:hypothetical protein [Holophagaceae bacterium]